MLCRTPSTSGRGREAAILALRSGDARRDSSFSLASFYSAILGLGRRLRLKSLARMAQKGTTPPSVSVRMSDRTWRSWTRPASRCSHHDGRWSKERRSQMPRDMRRAASKRSSHRTGGQRRRQQRALSPTVELVGSDSGFNISRGNVMRRR